MLRTNHQCGVIIGELVGTEPAAEPVGDGVTGERAEHSK